MQALGTQGPRCVVVHCFEHPETFTGIKREENFSKRMLKAVQPRAIIGIPLKNEDRDNIWVYDRSCSMPYFLCHVVFVSMLFSMVIPW
jgi:hypothetical protein